MQSVPEIPDYRENRPLGCSWVLPNRRAGPCSRLVDPPIDGDPGRGVRLDMCFGVQRQGKVASVLGQVVVLALAVAEGFVDRVLEAVEEPQLEAARALEEMLELGERQRDLGNRPQRVLGQAAHRQARWR